LIGIAIRRARDRIENGRGGGIDKILRGAQRVLEWHARSAAGMAAARDRGQSMITVVWLQQASRALPG
jgi:hypothetical protein